MSCIVEVVVELQREIALAGSSGTVYENVLQKFEITPKVGFFIARQFLVGSGIYFKDGLAAIDFDTHSLEEFTEKLAEITCFAPIETIRSAIGIECPKMIPGEENGLYSILEAIARSETKGCLMSELSSFAGSQVHNYIDRLVGLDVLVKRSVNPVAGARHSRVTSKSTVVHNKRFAPYYDDAGDGVRVIVSSSYLDRMHELILFMLQQRNAKMLPVRDLARVLGMSRWDMQALRNASIAQDRKEPTKVKFFLANCQSYGPDGILSVPRLSWCAGGASDPALNLDDSDGRLTFQCTRNVPLHEAIAMTLASKPDGLTASDLRALTGVSLKRAAKLFTSFNKQFGYPVEKVQEGKQLKHKLMPKDLQQAGQLAARLVHGTSNSSNAAAAAAISSSNTFPSMLSAHPQFTPIPLGTAAAMDATQPTVMDVVVLDEVDEPAGTEDKKQQQQPGTKLVSDMQALNNSIILDFIATTGGVASTTDIIGEVRQQHRRIRLQQLQQQQSALGEAGSGVVSGPGTNVDRRTIERTLQRLEHVMHRVVSCSAAAQSAETSAAETLALVALTDMDDQQRAKAVEDYLLARAVKIESTVPDLLNSSATSLDPPALLSQTKKRLAEASAGTKPQRGKAAETMVSSASKARKRRRRADSGSDSENEYSLSQSSPHTSSSSSEDSDSDSGGVASDRGKPTRKRLTREDIAVTRTTEGVDQRKARHNAINQKKVQHDAHIFDSTGLLPTTEHYEALRHQHSDDNGALLRLAEVESPGFFVQCMLFHNFLQQCVVKTVSSHTSASAAVGQGRRGSSATATFLHAGEQVEVLLPALLLNFPVHFFLRTSAAMRKLLLEFTANNTDHGHNLAGEIQMAVEDKRTCREFVDKALSSELGRLLKQYLDSPVCRAEHVVLLGALAAFGVLRPALSVSSEAGELPEIILALQEKLSSAPAATAQGAPDHAHVFAAAVAPVKPAIASIAQSHMVGDIKTYTALVSLLQHDSCRAALSDNDLSAAVYGLYLQPHSLNHVPVGAWVQLRSELDVYHHWLSVILPSLPICWSGIRDVDDVTSMTHLGRHVLHYCEVEKGISAAAPASAEEDGYFDLRLRMTYWGSPQLAQLWKGQSANAFCWRDLLPGGLPPLQFHEETGGYTSASASAGGAPVFSLDMPRRAAGSGTAAQRKKRSLTSLGEQNPAAANATAAVTTTVTGSARKKTKLSESTSASAAPKAKRTVRMDPELQKLERSLFATSENVGEDNDEEEGKGELEAGDDGKGLAAARPMADKTTAASAWELKLDAQLEEEVKGLHELDEVEWSAKQIAIILEVVLVNYFAKRQGAGVPIAPFASVSEDAVTSAAVNRMVPVLIAPGSSSCFDCNWTETDFSLVSEILLNASIAASKVPDQKVAKNRLLQCVKYRPRLLSIVAWVMCNKGSQVSSSLSGILNAMLGTPAGGACRDSTASDSPGADRQAALTTMLQTYACPGLSKEGLLALQSHSIDAVRSVTKELLQIGFLKKCENCGSEKCSQKGGPCRHNKRAYDLTEAFYEVQSDSLLAPYYLECLLGSNNNQSGPQSDTSAPLGTLGYLLEELHSDTVSQSFKVLAVSQLLCARSAALASTLELVAPEEHILAGAPASALSTLAVDTSGPGPTTLAREGTEEVLFVGLSGAAPPLPGSSAHRVEASHSGFCEKPLNSVVLCDITACVPSQLPAASSGSLHDHCGLMKCALEASSHGGCVPWLLLDGTVNVALLCGLASNVLAVLAERPGAPRSVIHTALCILSATQTAQLLQVMRQAGLVEERAARVDARLRDPFATLGTDRRNKGSFAATNTASDAGYFIVNKF